MIGGNVIVFAYVKMKLIITSTFLKELNQLFESGSDRIRIPLGPWIRIQRYKMKGKAELNQHFFWFFL